MYKQIYTPLQDYKVLCHCVTYNQAKFIEDTLDGFAMQKTNFSFICYVIDDCSTDGEQDVIKSWIERECNMSKTEYVDLELSDVILVPHKINTLCTFAFYFLKRNLWKEPKLKASFAAPWREHCHYEAPCEGDDYWIDPLKLQEQVDILDNNPQVTLVHTGFANVDENNEKIVRPNYEHHMEISKSGNVLGNLIINGNYIMTMSTCYRMDVIKSDIYNKLPLKYDYLLALSAASLGDIHYIPKRMAAYRSNNESVTHINGNTILKDIIQILYHVGDYYLAGKTRSVTKEEDLLIRKILIYKSFKTNCLQKIKPSYFKCYLRLRPSLIFDLIDVFVGKLIGKYKNIG